MKNYEEIIKDLEAKLAEMTEKYNACQEARKLEAEFNSQDKNELRQQLAEKKKEIKTMQESSDKNIDYLIEFASLIEDQKDCNRMLKALERVRTGKKYIVDKEHQDKISFCIEKLEQVRTQFRTKYSWYEETHKVCEKTDNFVIWLDNQIEQLKKEMK